MNETLYVKEIIKSAEFGGTGPVFIVASDGNEYILKFRMSDEGLDIQNFNEYIAYKIDDHLSLGLSPQSIRFIELDELALELIEKAYRQGKVSQTSLEYAKQSLGVNIAIERLRNIQKATEVKNETFLKKLRRLDNLILNRDRYKENTNILKEMGKEQYYAIDYGLALLECRIYEALRDGTIGSHTLTLNSCNALKDGRYCFDGELMTKKFDIKEFGAILTRIIDEMPKEWEALKYKSYIVDLFTTRLSKNFKKEGPCPFELFT